MSLNTALDVYKILCELPPYMNAETSWPEFSFFREKITAALHYALFGEFPENPVYYFEGSFFQCGYKLDLTEAFGQTYFDFIDISAFSYYRSSPFWEADMISLYADECDGDDAKEKLMEAFSFIDANVFSKCKMAEEIEDWFSELSYCLLLSSQSLRDYYLFTSQRGQEVVAEDIELCHLIAKTEDAIVSYLRNVGLSVTRSEPADLQGLDAYYIAVHMDFEYASYNQGLGDNLLYGVAGGIPFPFYICGYIIDEAVALLKEKYHF